MDAHVAGIGASVVVRACADGQHGAVGAQRDGGPTASVAAAAVARGLAVDVGAATRPLVGDAVPFVHAHVALTVVVVARADGQHGAVGAQRNGAAADVGRGSAVDIIAAPHPSSFIPRVHAHVAGMGASAVVADCTDCQHGAVGAQRDGAAALVVRILAVDVVAALHPSSFIPRVDAHVAGVVDARAVVVWRANGEHGAVSAQRDATLGAAQIAAGLAVEVVAALRPRAAAPRVDAHVPGRVARAVVARPANGQHGAVGAQ